ncbi:MAG: hypothetical protein UH241_11395 [Acutalibacteraceae bacterium]|nr:hypothetical protein [Acutalibacteraceae bacterium]
MGYLYATAFALSGIFLLIFSFKKKEYRILLVASIYFIFMGIYWCANELLPNIDLMGGVYVWIIRFISLLVFAYYIKNWRFK